MSKGKSEPKRIKLDSTSLVCKPLDSYSEILLFLENPPPWRSLCKELTPHSTCSIRNIDINTHNLYRALETPDHFCHFDPDLEEVKRQDTKTLPKTLVCHDMANGYHDDSIIDGTCNANAYTFYNWGGIDIFCYFSHHLITIPPVGWINVGHAHGVQVIGTVITEWAEGITFWEQVLASETEYQNLASALVAIAKTLKFDGYLLNIENKILKPDVLLEFVRYFHGLIHSELEHGLLIWYDSVTVQGNLNWQNSLNERNKAFFDACDGFFTNYSWTPADVASSAALAGARINDLFIGLDVWGRNFYGGGQFNTQEAVKVAFEAGCSLALFAPAWTHEALGDHSEGSRVHLADHLDSYGEFLLRDRALWGSLWPYVNTKLPCHLPFQTSFCRGQGRKRRMYGEVLSPSAWYNLRHQQYQPNAAHGPHGYILTTLDNIIKVQRSGQDKKGIIRIRTSFQQASSHIDPAPLFRDSDEEERTDVVIKSDDSGTGGTAKCDERKEAKKEKNKIKDALKNFFKHKSVKIDDTVSKDEMNEDQMKIQQTHNSAHNMRESKAGPSAVVAPAQAAQAAPAHAAHAGRSMAQMSVNLRLSTAAGKTRYALAHVAEERECLELYLDDSFTGGACLKVNPSDKLCPEHRHSRLFFCDFACERALVFCVVTKTLRQYSEQTLNVNLHLSNAAGLPLTVTLAGRDVAQSAHLDAAAAGIRCLYPVAARDLPALRAHLLLHEPGFYVPIDNCYGWTVRYYEVSVPGARLTSINLRTGLPQGGILLGHFGVCRKIHESSTVES